MSSFKYDLSIALIVKNEEKVLRRCLDSLAPLREALSCQIIITDTGSTDATIEIAKEYADTFIEFKWINDFSAARNTGVEVAEGRWFLYIDADEYFDESALRIVDFLKSTTCDKYDSATLKLRNYLDDGKRHSDAFLHRLANFKSGKTFFKDAIHEHLPVPLKHVFAIDAILHHDGYIGAKLLQKSDRNQSALDRIIEDDPLDIRARIHSILGRSDMEIRLRECEEAIKIFEENNLPSSTYSNALYSQLCNIYYTLKRYHEAIEIGEKFLKINSENILPVLAINQVLGDSKYHLGDYNGAITSFKAYQKICAELDKKPDVMHGTVVSLSHISPIQRQNSNIIIAKCYNELGNLKESKAFMARINLLSLLDEYQFPMFLSDYFKIMLKLKMYSELKEIYTSLSKNLKFRTYFITEIEKILPIADSSTRNALIEEFSGKDDAYLLINGIRSADFDLSTFNDNELNLIAQDDLILNQDCFSDVIYASVKSGRCIVDLFPHLKAQKLYKLIEMISTNRLDWFDTTYNYLKKLNMQKISPMQCLYYRDLSYSLLSISEKNATMHGIGEKIVFLFGFFIELSQAYISAVYNLQVISDNLPLLSERDTFAFIVHPAYSARGKSPADYLRTLKEALKYDVALSDAVKYVLEDVAKLSDKKNEQSNEFAQLAIQVKAQISQFISIGKLSEAKMLVEQYAKINPSDPELPSLYEKLK